MSFMGCRSCNLVCHCLTGLQSLPFALHTDSKWSRNLYNSSKAGKAGKQGQWKEKRKERRSEKKERIKREEWQENDSKRDRSGHSKTAGEGRPEGRETGREMGRAEERPFSFLGRNWMSSFTISWRLVNWAGKLRMSSNWGLAKSLRKCKSFC